jgi:hypothetical protein
LQKNQIKTENTSQYDTLSEQQIKEDSLRNFEKLNLNSPTEIHLNDESENFDRGVMVIITEGEYKGLKGEFISYSKNEKAIVLFNDLGEAPTLPLKYLKKCIPINSNADISGKNKELSITNPPASEKVSKNIHLCFKLASGYENINFLSMHENSPYKSSSDHKGDDDKSFYLPMKINICKKDEYYPNLLDFKYPTVFYKFLQKKFGKVHEEYIFYSKLDFKSYYLFQRILNRQYCYEILENLINTRILNWKPDKNFNDLIGVASVAGGGKTLFLQSIPFYLKNESCLPLYITFNNKTNYKKKYDTTAEKTINSRLIHSLYDNLFPTEKIDEDDIKYFNLKTIYKNFSTQINLDTPTLIRHLLTLTKKKSALILVDEIKKIDDINLRNEVISLLGSVLDDMINTNIVISTLDWNILEKERTQSNRFIRYIYFSPLTELFKTLDNIKELKDKKFLKLRLVQTSAIPRMTEQIFLKIKNQPGLIDQYNSGNNDWVEYVNRFELNNLIEEFISLYSDKACCEEVIINALNFSLAKSQIDFYTQKAWLKSNQSINYLKVGDLVKYGIYMGVYAVSKRPILNIYFILNFFDSPEISVNVKYSPDKPIYHLLELLKFSVNPQHDDRPDRFEECMARLDILKRMFYYHNYNLNPKETDTTKKEKTTYTELFGSKIFCFGKNEEFNLAPAYTLNDSFRNKEFKEDIKHIFKGFSENDYDLFFNKSNMFFNLKSGFAFDSVVFDPPNMITFFQDKQRDPTKGERDYNINKIIKTLKKCKYVFNDIKEILKKKSPYQNINANELQWRLVFRTLKLGINYSNILNDIKDKNAPPNLVLIGLEDLEAEFEGMFEILIYYFQIERIYDKIAPKKVEVKK